MRAYSTRCRLIPVAGFAFRGMRRTEPLPRRRIIIRTAPWSEPFRSLQLVSEGKSHVQIRNQNVDHSSKAPLKSDMKAGVQPNQEPGPKVPKQGDQPKSEEDSPNKGEGNENTGYSGGT